MELILSRKIEEARVLSSQKKSDTTSPYNDDDEITSIFQRKLNKLYYMLVDKAENYFGKIQEYPDTSQSDNLILPANFYKLIDVYLNEGRNKISILPIDQISAKRNDINNSNFPSISYGNAGYNSEYYFTLFSNYIKITPDSRETKDFSLRYVEDIPDIKNIFKINEEDTSDKIELRIPKGFFDWVVYSTALDMVITKEDESRDLERQAALMWDDIVKWAEDRKTSYPDKIRMIDEGNYETQNRYGNSGRF